MSANITVRSRSRFSKIALASGDSSISACTVCGTNLERPCLMLSSSFTCFRLPASSSKSRAFSSATAPSATSVRNRSTSSRVNMRPDFLRPSESTARSWPW